jgi:hypothetical protein
VLLWGHVLCNQGNSLLRILNVAAFAVSGYASSEGRHCKPFNPLLGETYEANYLEKGIRFFSEKVQYLTTCFTEKGISSSYIDLKVENCLIIELRLRYDFQFQSRIQLLASLEIL